jgi:hypothetical protein
MNVRHIVDIPSESQQSLRPRQGHSFTLFAAVSMTTPEVRAERGIQAVLYPSSKAFIASYGRSMATTMTDGHSHAARYSLVVVQYPALLS